MTESPITNYERQLLALILVLIIVFVGFDLITDSAEGAQWSHLITELLIALGAAIGFIVLIKDFFRQKRQLDLSREVLLQKEKEVERWKAESQKHVQGLSAAIDAQLARWSLTPSEKEVALLILKGLSLKEIAQLRTTAEKTVRSQSVSIYSKSGLAGRSELSAFFLEDLLVPQSKQ